MHMKDQFKRIRKRIYRILSVSEENDRYSRAYHFFMIVAIFISLIPLTEKNTTVFSLYIDKVTVCIFALDYQLRLLTADYSLKKGKLSFLLFPFTFMALVDLLSILSASTELAMSMTSPHALRMFHAFRMLRTIRMLRAIKVATALKFFRYSKSLDIILDVIHTQKKPLAAVGTLAVSYILVAALVIFNVEPETFPSYFDAVYWATVSLTTVGYGDIYAISIPGRIVTMLSSFVGIAIVALPSGIITAGYLEVLQEKKEIDEEIE